MCRPCVTCKDPVEWQVISPHLPSSCLHVHMCIWSVPSQRSGGGGGGEQVRRRCCWTYRNWSVECLIDQMRQPWGDCLSRSSSLNRSRCEALSLLCLCVVAFCFFYSEELFLLKLSALNYCTELVRTNWPWRTCRELHVLVRYPKLRSVGCVNGKIFLFFFSIDVRKYLWSRTSLLILSVSLSVFLSVCVSVGLM